MLSRKLSQVFIPLSLFFAYPPPPPPICSLCSQPFHQEAREAMLTKEKVEEDMRELSDTVEMATLDKEMAEERVRRG